MIFTIFLSEVDPDPRMSHHTRIYEVNNTKYQTSIAS